MEWVCGPSLGIRFSFPSLKGQTLNTIGQKSLNTLAMLSIQHDFCRIQNNWKLGTGKSQTSVISKQLGTPTEKIHFEFRILSRELSLFLELRPEDHWRHDSTLFCSQSFQLAWKHYKSRKPRLWWQSLMIKFALEGPPRHLPVQVSIAQQGESKKCLVCCCMNYVICQRYMYTVAKKAILSVCFVLSC